MTVIDAAATRALLTDPHPDLVVLDVRTPQEFHEGRLVGATMIDIYDDAFVEKILELDRTKPYLVYCRTGGRSAKAAEFMVQNGFVSVTDFGGGWAAWTQAGYEIEHG